MRSYCVHIGFSSLICLLFFAGGSWSHQDKPYMSFRGLIKLWDIFVTVCQKFSFSLCSPLAFWIQWDRYLANWWESTNSSAQNLPLIVLFIVIEDSLIRFVSSALLIICWLTHFVFYFVKLKAAIIKNRPYIFLFQIYIQRYGEIWLLWH